MRPCPPCKGTGIEPGTSYTDCGLCNGEGSIADPLPDEVQCNKCKGNGIEPGTSHTRCARCEGRGYREPRNAAEIARELGVRELPRPTGPSVVYIESGKPRTAHLEVVPILASLAGDIRICDPYYGTGTLLRLDSIADKPIRFLTQKPDSRENASGTLPRAIAEFVRQHTSIEFRQCSSNDLHDRFIVCRSELILLGQGLKDIGNKESFIVRLNRDVAADTIDQVIASFDGKWATGTSLT